MRWLHKRLEIDGAQLGAQIQPACAPSKAELMLIEEPLLCCVTLGVMAKDKRQEDEVPKSMLENSIKFCQELR